MSEFNLGIINVDPAEATNLSSGEAGIVHAHGQPELADAQESGSRLQSLKLKVILKLPVLSRYAELAAQTGCCGACGNCLGVAAVGLIPILGSKSDEQLPASED